MKKTYFILTLLFSVFMADLSAQVWTQQTSGIDSSLNDVYFINSDTGYVCGKSGIILKTINGGLSWISKNSGVNDGLACIQFVSSNIGYASGGFAGGAFMNCRLIKTIDGGDTWNNVSVAPTKCGGGICFISPDTGFYAYADNLYGNSTIVKTTDGGLNWSIVYTGTGWISYFHFVDANHGFATVGTGSGTNGTVLKTTDGGQSWSILNLPAPIWGSGVYFFNKDTGLIGGGPSNIPVSMFKTIDAGANWTPISSPDMIFKIFFSDYTNGYALSVDNTGAGSIIKSVNGGDNWVSESTPTGNYRGLHFLNSNLGFAVGDSGIIIKYSTMVGIENGIPQTNPFTLFPNPTSDIVTLNIDDTTNEDLTLTIYSVLGKLIRTETLLQNQKQINVKDLNKGIYVVEIKSLAWSKKQKLIIQK